MAARDPIGGRPFAMYAIANLDLRTISIFPIRFTGGFLLLIAVELVGNSGMGAQRWLNWICHPATIEFMRFALIMALRAITTLCIAMMFRSPWAGCAYGDDWPTRSSCFRTAGFGHGVDAGSQRHWPGVSCRCRCVISSPVLRSRLLPCRWFGIIYLNIKKNGSWYSSTPSATRWSRISYYSVENRHRFRRLVWQGHCARHTKSAIFTERHTDFVFAIYAEELGFIGSLILIFLFAVMIFLMFNIAAQMRHRFSQLTIAGFAFALSIYVTVNLAMVMGLAPVVVCRCHLFLRWNVATDFYGRFGRDFVVERQPMADLPK